MPDAVELAGLGCVAVAAFLVATALGFLVLGLLLVLVAQGLDGAPLAALVRGWVARLPHAGQGDS